MSLLDPSVTWLLDFITTYHSITRNNYLSVPTEPTRKPILLCGGSVHNIAREYGKDEWRQSAPAVDFDASLSLTPYQDSMPPPCAADLASLSPGAGAPPCAAPCAAHPLTTAARPPSQPASPSPPHTKALPSWEIHHGHDETSPVLAPPTTRRPTAMLARPLPLNPMPKLGHPVRLSPNGMDGMF
ncbi:hypothetical protein CALVIDRAFT_569394 [Calocera viscosa TUFC12733]|uniref:Uncharacterized protein n=1 Tax=Calocera viscosa (strain TUFC12733) TaxID=1330018 RepID=A0A167G1F0_CALVF|nr:hypothetical protein CALVIDRAFT_569394 [Calocera viscosa TUFC12733]